MSYTESKRFHGKLCLITGAGSGIGRATAIKMSSLGASLALSDINETSMDETVRLCMLENEVAIDSEVVDIQNPQSVNEYVTRLNTELGGIDFVFNCAGVNPTKYALTETSDEYFDLLVNTNLRGTYNITRACIPFMPAGSSIVNVASIMGIEASAGYAIYCATKWGIVGFTKAMALELGPRGIRVNAVAPGYINTPTNAGVVEGQAGIEAQERRVAMGRMGTPEEIADVVAFLFSQEARYMNGSIVEVNGGRI